MAATEVRGLDVLIKIGSQVVGGQRNASLELIYFNFYPTQRLSSPMFLL